MAAAQITFADKAAGQKLFHGEVNSLKAAANNHADLLDAQALALAGKLDQTQLSALLAPLQNTASLTEALFVNRYADAELGAYVGKLLFITGRAGGLGTVAVAVTGSGAVATDDAYLFDPANADAPAVPVTLSIGATATTTNARSGTDPDALPAPVQAGGGARVYTDPYGNVKLRLADGGDVSHLGGYVTAGEDAQDYADFLTTTPSGVVRSDYLDAKLAALGTTYVDLWVSGGPKKANTAYIVGTGNGVPAGIYQPKSDFANSISVSLNYYYRLAYLPQSDVDTLVASHSNTIATNTSNISTNTSDIANLKVAGGRFIYQEYAGNFGAVIGTVGKVLQNSTATDIQMLLYGEYASNVLPTGAFYYLSRKGAGKLTITPTVGGDGGAGGAGAIPTVAFVGGAIADMPTNAVYRLVHLGLNSWRVSPADWSGVATAAAGGASLPVPPAGYTGLCAPIVLNGYFPEHRAAAINGANILQYTANNQSFNLAAAGYAGFYTEYAADSSGLEYVPVYAGRVDVFSAKENYYRAYDVVVRSVATGAVLASGTVTRDGSSAPAGGPSRSIPQLTLRWTPEAVRVQVISLPGENATGAIYLAVSDLRCYAF